MAILLDKPSFSGLFSRKFPMRHPLPLLAIFFFLLALAGGLYFARFEKKSDPVSVSIVPRITKKERVDSVVPELAADSMPADVAPKGKTPDVKKDAATAFIKETISLEWIDAPEKLAGRQRVRIVKSDFKYPLLRLEESVSTDEKTGEENITLVRASVADHVMIGLRPGSDEAAVQRILEDKGYTIRSVEPGSFIIAEIPDYEDAEDQKNAISAIAGLDEFIDFAEPDYLVFPSLNPNDPGYSSGKLWGLHNPGTESGSKADADIDAPEAWALRTDASGVIVAVTDTGINYTHEGLAANMWTDSSTGSHGFDAYEDDDNPMDTGGHGTHCAGTIGASGNNGKGMTGVAWKVQLMALRFLGPNGGSTSDGIRVINFARLNGANIISASWGGGGYSQSLYNAINACRAADIPFVAAAGNDSLNNDSNPHYPSSYNLPNIVAVASTTKNDTVSTFSCYGKNSVDIAAPGSSIYSTYIGSNTAYTFLNGTSMATPHVSGALAMAKAQFPTETAAQLIARLYSSADPIPALAQKVSSKGRLNLDRLLRGAVQPKSNDNFVDAYRFDEGYGTWSGTNADATHEPDEDSFSIPGIGNRSLWFAFRSTHVGLVNLSAYSNLTGYRMVIFEGGTKGSLRVVDDTRDVVGTLRASLYFTAKADTEYRVLLDAHIASAQMFALTFSQTPPNDFFSSATLLTGESFTVTGSNRGATEELFEKAKPHAGLGRGKTVWWKWTAAHNGSFTINTRDSDFDTVLAVYAGSSTASLTEIVSNDDRNGLDHTSQVTFQAVAGTTYHIAVDGYREDTSGKILLNGFTTGFLTIVRQPLNLQVEIGQRAEFGVSVLGDGQTVYQWFKGETALPGEVSTTLTIDPVKEVDLGAYHVEVTNGITSAISDIAILAEKLRPPVITWKSGDTAVAIGDILKLGVLATGSDPISYVWEKDETVLPDQTTARIDLGAASQNFSGIYKCTASNPAGSAAVTMRVKVVQSPFESFAWSRESVPGGSITDLKVFDGKCYAVADDRILVSENGNDWSEWKLPAGFSGSLITKLGSNWLCTGYRRDGKQAGAISSDGVAWADPTAITVAVSYGSTQGPGILQIESFGGKLVGTFPVSGGSNWVLESADGILWTEAKKQAPGDTLISFTTSCRIFQWGGKFYLPSGRYPGNASILTSLDGAVWTETAMPLNPSGDETGAGQFVSSCGGKLYFASDWGSFSSADGETWTFEARKRWDTGRDLRFAESAEGCFAFRPKSQTFLFTPTSSGWKDDTNLISRNLQTSGSQKFTCAATFEGSVIFGTENGLLKQVAKPNDVILPNDAALSLKSIHFVNGEFLAYRPTSNTEPRPVLISGDGRTWRQGRSFQPNTESLDPPGAFIAGRYLGGAPWVTSPAAAGWAPSAISKTSNSLPVGMNKAIGSAAFDGTRWLVLSSQQVQSVSADGATWTTLPASGYSPGLRDRILRFKGRWYANSLGGNNTVYSSDDGIVWTKTPSLQLINLTVFGDKLCGTDADGYRVHTSQDGITWNTFPVNHRIGTIGGGALRLQAVRLEEFNGSLVLLLKGEFEKRAFLYFSNDAELWTNVAVPAGIRDFTSGNGTFCLTTENGGILLTRAGGTPAVAAPLVSINSPAHKSLHVNGSFVGISGTAISPDGGTVTTKCFVDGVLLGTSTSDNFLFNFRPSNPSGHIVKVRSEGPGGLIGSDEILVSVTSPQLENRLESEDGKNRTPIIAWTSFGNRVYAVDAYSLRRSRDDGT